MGWRSSSAAVVLAVVLGACGGVSEGSDDTAVPTAEVAPAEESAALAEYLADHSELSGGVAEALAAPADGADLALSVAVYDDFVTSLEQLDPPNEAKQLHAQTLATYRQVTEAMRTVLGAIEADDEVAGQQVRMDLLEALDAFGRETVGIVDEWTRLLMSLLATRPDLPEAVYFLEWETAGQGSVSSLFQEVFSVFGLIESDPDGALVQLAPTSEEMNALVGQARELDPPPSLADLHQRHLRSLEESAAAFQALYDALRDGEPIEPAIEEIGNLSLGDAPAIGAEMNRAMVRVLRVIADAS